MYYQKKGATGWTSILKDSTTQVHHSTLGLWNTQGLLPGDYLLRLVVKDNFKDSVEAIKPVVVQSGITGITHFTSSNTAFKIYPNPVLSILTVESNTVANEPLEILNALGQEVFQTKINNQQSLVDISAWPNGLYLVRMGEKTRSFFKN